MYRKILNTLLLGALALVVSACGSLPVLGGPPSNAVIIEVRANTSLESWLVEAVNDFNNKQSPTAAGQPVWVELVLDEAGQAVVNITENGASPALWIPDNQVWVNILADQGNAFYTDDCSFTAQSPLVIAMWRPIAESLGYPGRPLGWLDIGSLAADESAWAYYSGGQFGTSLRLGHTHPGLSGTGASTLLALVQAAQSKEEAVTTQDINEPIVQASVGAFEGAVSWFSKSTSHLAATMADRGMSFLGAAVVYENIALEYAQAGEGIVPIYPFEGTFMASHPACIHKNASLEAQEGALIFRSYLLSTEGQTLAVQHGLRPATTDIPLTAPFTKENGADPTQPEVIFAPPTLNTVYAVQDLWQSARKPVNLVMLLDTSGSMRGGKIDSLRAAAQQFVEQMNDSDYLTLIAFETQPTILLERAKVSESREQAVNRITGLEAGGNTSLYDAIGLAAKLLESSSSTQFTNAIIVLSDGQDTASRDYRFNNSLIELAGSNNTALFTIAYGSDADEEILQELAFDTNGNFFLGDEASIAAIYEEMSAAFGGSVGIGR